MTHVDKKGIPFEVRNYRAGDYVSLENMYLAVSLEDRFQGMPPLGESACRAWVKNLLKQGENFVALRNEQLIGHVVIFPNFKLLDGEYLIYVEQSNRDRGVGTALTHSVLDRARALGLKIIWLVVSIQNYRAIGLYRKFHFEFVDKSILQSERKMVLKLQSSGTQ